MLPKLRVLVDWKATWIWETKNTGDFVIAFADRIIEGLTDNLEVHVVFHDDQFGVAAGDDDAEHRIMEFASILVGIDMAGQMMDWN